MKRLIIILVIFTVNVNNDITFNEEVKYKLQTVLEFIQEKYNEFHFDGLLGITFTHGR